MRSFAFAAVLGFAAAVEIEAEFMDNSWMNTMSDKSHWSSVADEWDFSGMKGGSHHHHDDGHSNGHGGHYGHYGHWGYGHGHESNEHDHTAEQDHDHESNEHSHTHEEQEAHPNPWEMDYANPWENHGDHANPWDNHDTHMDSHMDSHTHDHMDTHNTHESTHEHPDWSHYNGGHGHDESEHTEAQMNDGHSHHWGTHTHEGDDDHYTNPWENHQYNYDQYHHDHEEDEEPENEDEHDHHAPWDYWNGHKHEEEEHDHDVHPHDDEAEHFDMGELAYMIKALEHDIAQLEKGQLVEDVFMTNFETPLSMELDTPFTLIDPWCVAAGQTIDFAVQATFNNIEETTLGFALLKDGKPVAMARQADADSPSSLSLLFRETLHEQASFELAIKSDPPLEGTMVTVAANNIQVGLRIYDEGYIGTVNSMPANNCHAHGHGHYGKHDD